MSACYSERGKRRKRFLRMLSASRIARCTPYGPEARIPGPASQTSQRREVPARHFRTLDEDFTEFS